MNKVSKELVQELTHLEVMRIVSKYIMNSGEYKFETESQVVRDERRGQELTKLKSSYTRAEKINDIDQDIEITLVHELKAFRYGDDEMFDTALRSVKSSGKPMNKRTKEREIMIEEPMKMKKKDQISLDEELAFKQQAREEKKKGLPEKKLKEKKKLTLKRCETRFGVGIKSLLEVTTAKVCVTAAKQNLVLFKDMDQDSTHMVAASKVPMLKPENGNSPPITKVVEGVETIIAPTTAEEKAQRRLELKARSTLLRGIPNEHQLKFNSIKDAKSLI
ncbi:hypothetical protein Tco_1174452 [Tanacetum coccineum]